MSFSESVSGDLITAIRFAAHTHRNVDNRISLSAKTEFVDSTIEQWQADIGEIETLATQFYRTYKED